MSMLKQIMEEFDAAKEDEGWDECHPIFLMAEEIDDQREKIKSLEKAISYLEEQLENCGEFGVDEAADLRRMID